EEKTKLAEALGLTEKELSEKLISPKKFVWLKRFVDREVLEAVKGMRGIYSIEESRRFYPNGSLASHLLGAVGMESEALAGIELAADKFLESHKKEAVYRRDARGKFYISPVAYEEQDDVNDVYLTIDKQIQFAAENALQKAVESAGAKGGSAVVLDIETGEVLAMSNMPTFDANEYSKYKQDMWRNRAVTDTIEPGSTFKVLIVASALDAGVVTPEEIFDCENGAMTVGKAVLHDHDSYGKLSVKDIIRVSSNIGAAKIAREVGRERLYEYLKKFGIGSKTGIDYPGEIGGIVRDASTWQPVELATIAFGQGISVTPVQMATAFASIANGGKRLKPYVVDHTVNNQGMLIYNAEPTLVSEPISSANASTMIGMLERVVGQGGTGTRAASKEYPVAGKTGTAQKVVEGAGHYVAGKYYASFVGIAPSNDPKIAVFVGLDEPSGVHFGGVVSAPAFREITEATLKHMDIPSPLSKVVASGKDGRGDITAGHAEVRRFQKINENNFQVPDVRGVTIRDVMASVGQANIKLDIAGSGVAVSQIPSPGSMIKEGETFRVSFKQLE
ncbi:MAG: transpeptidase family protein, partial [Deltaproteobacteria bacterium]|nr:transpeptidase family protein [Deltaproteobacteria bacterium]